MAVLNAPKLVDAARTQYSAPEMGSLNSMCSVVPASPNSRRMDTSPLVGRAVMYSAKPMYRVAFGATVKVRLFRLLEPIGSPLKAIDLPALYGVLVDAVWVGGPLPTMFCADHLLAQSPVSNPSQNNNVMTPAPKPIRSGR